MAALLLDILPFSSALAVAGRRKSSSGFAGAIRECSLTIESEALPF